MSTKQMSASRRGRVSQLTGLAAEECVIRAYRPKNARLLDQRWRCKAGEIDVIHELDDMIVFTEVKARKSKSDAPSALTPAQLARVQNSALCYMGQCETKAVNMRIDLALVDRQGVVEIFENISM